AQRHRPPLRSSSCTLISSLYGPPPTRPLHSSPTRRSSDLYAGDLVAAVRATYERLEGHFTFVVVHHDEPQRLVGVRHQTPLETRSEEHTSELQSRENLVCRLLLEKKNSNQQSSY